MFGATEIFLSDKAFLSIILSSVEVYKNESHGALLGFKTPRRIIVEYAIPFQSARRKFTEVMPNWRRELKVIEVLPRLIHLQKLGYYHSHPQFGKKRGTPELSKTDREYMQPGEIEIVVAINDSKRSSPWKESKNKLSGTLGKYHITIAGFYKRKRNDEITQYRVLCPYAIGFDYTFEQPLV
ncbi:MAG: hypothetical protein QHH12_07550 [Candidatus Bathyarchaeota archaeon]|jgi:hypothetical protein|nr:hypothetical protein [Candidatus Bathyarchaeota archaeon A05DMB-3]MDH7607593.1 hypothetical protein [Candidatus Bathyarchaeota archaeon]